MRFVLSVCTILAIAFWTGYSVVHYFTVLHHQIFFFFFFRRKTDTLLVLIPGGTKRCWKLFFRIEDPSSCPKINLVSTGQATPHITEQNFEDSLSTWHTALSWPSRSSYLITYNFFSSRSNSWTYFPDISFIWRDIFLTLLCPHIHFPDIYFSENFISRHIFSWHQCGFPDTHFTEIISVYFNVYWWLGYNYSMCQCG